MPELPEVETVANGVDARIRGDRIEELPNGFSSLGVSDHSPFCAVGDDARKIYGLQFHPEVVHTARGKEILDAFLFAAGGVTAPEIRCVGSEK